MFLGFTEAVMGPFIQLDSVVLNSDPLATEDHYLRLLCGIGIGSGIYLPTRIYASQWEAWKREDEEFAAQAASAGVTAKTVSACWRTGCVGHGPAE